MKSYMKDSCGYLLLDKMNKFHMIDSKERSNYALRYSNNLEFALKYEDNKGYDKFTITEVFEG